MAKDPLDSLREQAQQAVLRGQYQDARQIYQQALGHRSDNPEIHFGIATACFMLGDLHSAVYHFKEVIHLDPLRAGAFINLGAVYNRLGQLEDALAILRRGIQVDPHRAEGYYNLGLVFRQLGQMEMAVNSYREAIRLNPRMYDAHYNLGNILFEKGEFAKAVAHYRAALETRPNWEKGLNALEAAEAELAAQDASFGSAEIPTEPVGASPPESKLDPERLIDPAFHGKLLRALHDLVVETDHQSQAMLKFLQQDVEATIRELSIAIVTPQDSRYNLDEQVHRFDNVVTRLQQLQEALQKSIASAKLMGEQIAKV